MLLKMLTETFSADWGINDYFKNSKTPGIFYHGGSKVHNRLDPTCFQKYDEGYLGTGFYLTSNRQYAEEYGPCVQAFRVKMENPFCIDELSTNLGLAEALAEYLVNACVGADNKLPLTYTLSSGRQTSRLLTFIKGDEEFDPGNCIYNAHVRDASSKPLDASFRKLYRELLFKIMQNLTNWEDGYLADFSVAISTFVQQHGYDGILLTTDWTYPDNQIVVYKSNQLKYVDNLYPTDAEDFDK